MEEAQADRTEAPEEPNEPKQPVKLAKDASQNDVAEAKSVIPAPQKFEAATNIKKGPNSRDSVLERVETKKRLALVQAWEENEKAKVEIRAHKKISAIGSRETAKKAGVESQLKRIEEKLEKKKAEYSEKMKNKVVEIHMEAEEKRAVIEAKRGDDFVKREETAAKFRAAGYTPNKFLGCFSS